MSAPLAAQINRMLRASEARQRRVRERLYAKRAFSLSPNDGQTIKLARYSVGLTCDFTLGEPVAILGEHSPAVRHRTRRVIMNAPCPNFIWIRLLCAANVAAAVGGLEDAWVYKPESRVLVDWPTLPRSQTYSFEGEYTGLSPAPFQPMTAFRFGISLIGPALLCDSEGAIDHLPARPPKKRKASR